MLAHAHADVCSLLAALLKGALLRIIQKKRPLASNWLRVLELNFQMITDFD